MFQEKQKFRQKWLWVILYSLLFLSIVLMYRAYANNPPGLFTAILPVIIVASLVVLFMIMELDTRIDISGIYYRFFPFQVKHRYIKKSDIDEVAVASYKPVKDYGGWGIRFSKQGKAYTTGGHFGIQIKLISGKFF